MAVWVVRGGIYEEEALENSVLTIGYGITSNLTDMQTRNEVRRLVQLDLGSENNDQIGQITGQIWSFKNLIKKEDLIVMPRKGQPTFAIGRMAGEYNYLPDRLEQRHSRLIQWINKEAPKSSLDQDLTKILNYRKTVTPVKDDRAEERLLAIAEGIKPEPVSESSSEDDENVDLTVNLEEDANNRIRDYIEKNYHGHEFTRLVAAVLQAQGYAVEVAPPGPDGGVDIVAGSGPMGFDPPRICVQVKSGIQTANVSVLRQLEGIIKNFGADYGLLVSWGGFTGEARSEARKGSFFNVRLWDSEAFLNALFDNYDRLPAGLKAELPLKQVWILDEPTL